MKKQEILIVGGGLAGLVSAFLLARKGHAIRLIEKKNYPFHRVCGEYLSNEVMDFLRREGLFPEDVAVPEISKFEFSDLNGKSVIAPLDLGGIGISRYLLDEYLYKKALKAGADIQTGVQVEELKFDQSVERFHVELSSGELLEAEYVLGAFGKRSKIDSSMNRSFMKKRSPFIGVKYHIRIDRPADTVALHNFSRGYCGMNAVEDGRFNLCYLGHREDLRFHESIARLEQELLCKNPILAQIFNEAEFLFEKPEVINEISFERKSPLEDHVMMLGDAAGMITPLNGNGMAMAIRAAYLADQAFDKFSERKSIEQYYATEWNKHFRNRLYFGRALQKLFGSDLTSSFARVLLADFPFFSRKIIQNTHGAPF